MRSLREACTDLARRELERRAAEAELCRRSFADFVQIAIAQGVVDGIRRVDWGPHLETHCRSLQFQYEGWIVANGPARASKEWPAWAERHAEMIQRQRDAWEREYEIPVPEGEEPRLERPTWEDGEPEPWLRYVLLQNEVDNLPPATLKSTLACVLINAWVWLWAPAFAFAALSGNDSNVERDAKATRELVRSRWYRETFSIGWEMFPVDDVSTQAAREAARLANEELGVKRDTDAVSDWATTAGGKRRSRTLNAGLTGSHNDGITLDDPDDADKVWGEAERVRPQNRWTRAGENRVNCEKRSIRRVLQQRTHVEDFTAYVLSKSRWSPSNTRGWAWLCLPAEYGFGPEDAPRVLPFGPVEWRAEKGRTIHPNLSPGVLVTARGRNESGYEGQYNQNPARVVNGILERRHARFFVFEEERELIPRLRERPTGCLDRVNQPPVVIARGQLRHRTLSVDANNTLDLKPGAKPSAVGLTVDAMIGGDTFVLDDRTKVLDVSGTYLAIYETIAAWQLDEVLVELKAAGAAVVAALRETIRRGWFMHPVTDKRTELLGPDGKPARPEIRLANPKESKTARNQGLVEPWQRGTFFLHDGAGWLYAQADLNRKLVDEGFIGEVCSWPKSRRGDRMDSLSQYAARHRPTPAAGKTSSPPIVLTVQGGVN